jgi:hypothetical protein
MRMPPSGKIYRVSKRSVILVCPPGYLSAEALPLIPMTGFRAAEVADMVLPSEDRLWILLHACGLEERKCLVFARICALRCLALWMSPYPDVVVRYLRTGKRTLAREAREAAMGTEDHAMEAAAWASTVPLSDPERLNLKLRRWTRVSAPCRAYAAALSARRAGISGEDQISDLLAVMDTHPTVLALRMSAGHFELGGVPATTSEPRRMKA